jgi:hypothetical protein
MDEKIEITIKLWEGLGGVVNLRKGWPTTTYLKLMHPDYDSYYACLAIDLDSEGNFLHFANVRMRDIKTWDKIYSEIAEHFDAYFPPDRGAWETGRQNRIECIPLDWSEQLINKYLEITLEYWLSQR